jgi:carbon monoxide dehydrogenase subunit G
MYPCRAVGVEFFEQAPNRSVAEVTIRATPEQLFDVFEDAEAWTAWVPVIQKVEWTSPRPFGPGTTRTVTMKGGAYGKERFFLWERGKRMAFHFTEGSSSGVAAFAEDYQVTDLGDGRTHLRWVMALEPKGVSTLVFALFGWMLGLGMRFMLGRLKTYAESRYPAARAA